MTDVDLPLRATARMTAHGLDPAALDALARSDDGLPAGPGDAELIDQLDEAYRYADEHYLARAMAQAEADYAAWRESVFGPNEGDGL